MELLAHASAPSSRKDDERFKRQATAYSSFQASNVVSVQQSQYGFALPPSSVPSVTHFDSPVYMENTQDAWTALDSQLFAPSDQSVARSELESDEDGHIDGTALALPVDSSHPPRAARDVLPPDDSAVFKVPVARVSTSRSLSSQPGPRIRETGQYMPTPSRHLQINEHVTPSYLDGLSTVSPLETPSRRIAFLRTAKLPPRQDDFSSPSDDIPSQLPSTYSISGINSDPVHSDQPDGPPSSAWGSLPRGIAAQQWNGVIEEESPLKGLRSLAPTGHEDISSASLDRAVVPRQRQQTEPPRATFSSSFELRFSSAPQAVGTQSGAQDDEIPSSLDKQDGLSQHPLRSSFDLRFSSAPQAQGTQPSDVEDSAVPAMLRRQSLSELMPTSFDSQFSSSPEAQGTQNNSGNETAVPQALRQHTLDQLPPTSFESRFSSSPDALGTPFVEKDRRREDTAEASSSPGTKINLFQPRLNLLAAKPRLSMSLAMQKDIPKLQHYTKSAVGPTRSSPWQPISSASETGSAFQDRAQSASAVDVSTLLHNGRVEKRSGLSAGILETALAAKRRKFASLSTPKTKPNTQERELFKTLSLQIRPPPPPTGSKHFITHITPQLEAQFWDTAELQGKYKPFLTRPLRTSERGYWQFDTRAWNAQIQIKFWKFLQSNIGSGISGWGVWCLREHEGKVSVEEGTELGMVKVFCWGEVVGHIWLLCYVASQAKLKHVESKWFDADEEVVVMI
ncbi:hypothetical protein E4T42_05153 [Aureobasidium subglaciale]|nr:hypothetical protein E4T42_05153 [Aureobasidium subglaciale]